MRKASFPPAQRSAEQPEERRRNAACRTLLHPGLRSECSLKLSLRQPAENGRCAGRLHWLLLLLPGDASRSPASMPELHRVRMQWAELQALSQGHSAQPCRTQLLCAPRVRTYLTETSWERTADRKR